MWDWGCDEAGSASARNTCKLGSAAAVGRPCQCQEEEARLGDVHRDRRQTGSQEIGASFSFLIPILSLSLVPPIGQGAADKAEMQSPSITEYKRVDLEGRGKKMCVT